jgi:quercetin dioxygenase-like cupin family protein
MTIQRLTANDFTVLENPGVISVQIVWGENAPDARATITRVTMQSGAVSPRHTHEIAEQTWLVERGEATLLLTDDGTAPLQVGDVVRTPAGDVHGIKNTGTGEFVYLAITTPPQNFGPAYERHRKICDGVDR